jgi:hypothetical protein
MIERSISQSDKQNITDYVTLLIDIDIYKYAICTPFLVKTGGCQILDCERNLEFCCGSKNRFLDLLNLQCTRLPKKIGVKSDLRPS